MELGIIGLGKMGFNMAERLRLAGHKVVGFDFNKDATARLTATGSLGVNSLEDLVRNLAAPRAISRLARFKQASSSTPPMIMPVRPAFRSPSLGGVISAPYGVSGG